MEGMGPYAFHNRLHEYLDLCMHHAVTVEVACESIREPPGPVSPVEVAALLRDPLIFHINVPYDGQLVYSRLLHAAVETHFSGDLPLIAQAVVAVLRASVEVLVQQHDGRIYRDAVRLGRACADRAIGEGASELAAELVFQLGRLHFEPVAPDPAYGALDTGLIMCLADRHDQQNWVHDEIPASQTEPLPDRTRMLVLAAEHFREAMRLSRPDLRKVIAGYLTFTEMEQAVADPSNTDLPHLLRNALAVADDIPGDADPTIGIRLRFYASLRLHRPPAIGSAMLERDFYQLVTEFGLSSVVATLVIIAPEDVPGPLRASWHRYYQWLADLRAMNERSRMSFRLLAGHCHPLDPIECRGVKDGEFGDVHAITTRFKNEPHALQHAALHWLHHQFFTSEATEVVRELIMDAEPDDLRTFLTVRGALETNSANRESSAYLSTARFLAAADDLLRAGFPVWAQHNLGVAEHNLGELADSDEDIVLAPVIPLLERLVEIGWTAGVRRKVASIVTRLTSIAITQIDRSQQRLGGVPVSLSDTAFELVQLSKARRLTARIRHGGALDVQDSDWFVTLAARLGGDGLLDTYSDDADAVLDEVGFRLASYMTRYEAKTGRNVAEILTNLRKMYGLSLITKVASGAAPAVHRRELQAVLDSRSVALTLQFCRIPQARGVGDLAVIAVASGRDYFTLNASVLPDNISMESLFRPTVNIEGSLYEVSPAGTHFARLLQKVLTDPLVRDVSAEAGEGLAITVDLLPGVAQILHEANDNLGADHLMVWPNKALYLLPYWLLPFRDGIVADHFLVTLLPTFQCLTRIRCPPPPNTVLAVGSSNGGASHGLPVVPSLTTTAIGIAHSFGTEALVGRRANPAAVLRQLPRHEFVHISAHGYQDRSAPMFHCVYLNAADSADGRLYAHQIMGLDLSAVRLVTLNACEGNLLRFDEFDEIAGLGSAFLHAGAAAVVAALWPICPEVGELFYAILYNHLARGAGTLTGFRAAQLATRQQYPEYRDWGAFCFVGVGEFKNVATS